VDLPGCRGSMAAISQTCTSICLLEIPTSNPSTLGRFTSFFHSVLSRVERRSAAARTVVSDCAGFRAKLTPTAFGTLRAFTHALPPSFALRSVPSPVSSCFSSLPLW
jgi:hypothetical protein